MRIPVPPRGAGWGFQEVNVRKGDFAIVAAAATMQIANGNVQNVACAIAGVGSHAIPLPAVATAVLGRTPDAATLSKAAAACAALVNPNSDMHASAAYRRDLTKTLVYRALSDARDRCS